MYGGGNLLEVFWSLLAEDLLGWATATGSHTEPGGSSWSPLTSLLKSRGDARFVGATACLPRCAQRHVWLQENFPLAGSVALVGCMVAKLVLSATQFWGTNSSQPNCANSCQYVPMSHGDLVLKENNRSPIGEGFAVSWDWVFPFDQTQADDSPVYLTLRPVLRSHNWLEKPGLPCSCTAWFAMSGGGGMRDLPESSALDGVLTRGIQRLVCASLLTIYSRNSGVLL